MDQGGELFFETPERNDWGLHVESTLGKLALQRAGVAPKAVRSDPTLVVGLEVLDVVSQGVSDARWVASRIGITPSRAAGAVDMLTSHYGAETMAQAVAAAIERKDLPVTATNKAKPWHLLSFLRKVTQAIIDGATSSAQLAAALETDEATTNQQYFGMCKKLDINPGNPCALVRRAYDLNVHRVPPSVLLFSTPPDAPYRPLSSLHLGVVTDHSLGLTSKESAAQAACTLACRQDQMRQAKKRLHAESEAEAVAKAIVLGLIDVQVDIRDRPILTPHETQIFSLIAQGHSNKNLSNLLGVSGNTVRTHINRSLHKLNATGREHAVRRLFETGTFVTLQTLAS